MLSLGSSLRLFCFYTSSGFWQPLIQHPKADGCKNDQIRSEM